MTRKDGIALVALALVVLGFFGPAVWGDRAVFTWNLDSWHPWRATASAEDLQRPTRLADCARQFYVMRHLATEAIREGRIPLWNPWIYGGTPFLANFQPGVFYPPNLLLALSPLDVADQMTAYLTLHLFWAAAGVFVLLRVCGASAGAATLGGLVFAFSGYNVARTGIPTMVATGAWLPWVLAASRRWFTRGDGAAFAGMALSLGMAGLAGFAQIFVFTAYAFGLWGLIDGLGRPRRGAGRRWAGWIAAGGLGLAITAVHLVPTLEFMQLGQDAANTPAMLASGTLHPWTLGKLVIPDLLGNPVDGTNATHLLEVGAGYYHQTERSTAIYVGILPLLLGLPVLLAPGDQRRAAAAALGLVAISLALCFAGPWNTLLTKLPALDFSRPDRATFLFCFAVAVLAGLGADRLAGREGPGAQRSTNGLALILGAGTVLFAAAIAWQGDRWLPPHVVALAGDSLRRSAGFAVAFTLAGAALVTARAFGRLPGRAFSVLAFLLVVADLALFSTHLNVLQPKDRIFPAPEPGTGLAYLQEKTRSDGPFRVFRWEPNRSQFAGVMPPSTGSIYGLQDVLGFDSLNLARWQELMQAIDPNIVIRRGNFRGPRNAEPLDSPLLDLLDVRYVLAEPGATRFPVQPARYTARSFPDLTLYERRPGADGAHPTRARIVSDVVVAASDSEALQRLAAPGFRADLRAVSVGSIPGWTNPATAGPTTPAGTASVRHHGDERVALEIEAERPGLLVLADAWFPGWKVSVDGHERPIHRVNHAFRGVLVQPGDREVIFTYAPDSFRTGAWVSIAALLLILALAGIFQLRRPRVVDSNT